MKDGLGHGSLAGGKMKEKGHQTICSGCGAEMGERKSSNEISTGICDACLKAISAEEDLVFSEKPIPDQDLFLWAGKKIMIERRRHGRKPREQE